MTMTVTSGPWDAESVSGWLRDTVIPVRLATSGTTGPIVQSLWFHFEEEALWCATQRESTVAQRIRRDPRVGWEVSPDLPPYRGVRGRGDAQILEDPSLSEDLLRRLLARYGQSESALASWLLGRIDSEIVLRITDLEVTSWDYSPRM